MKYYSQLQQDRIVDEYFKGKNNGFFVDIGAHDGIECSNSAFFEYHRDWTGICVEPGPIEYEKLTKNRRCTCINGCVSNYNGE